ncbi:thiol-activated cytolysin family protein [Aquimarina algiphila]|uniref:thiol-activated cytolysin family protein n=1 Tax=Aquimarina algiphila TaxID=2047982 RepID=UPI002492C4D2|nr:thiol-activated cytolysin family protein [Aquimarina algiphila]
MKNLKSVSKKLKSSWTGNWKTTYGILKLTQNGNKVTGDYANVGKIEGTISGDQLKGIFTNKSKKGSFSFSLEGNEFTGVWGWGNDLSAGTWSGVKDNNGKTNFENTPTNNIIPSKRKNISITKGSGNDKVVLSMHEEGEVSDHQKETSSKKVNRDCVTKTYEMDVNTSEIDFVTMNQNADWLKPGNLLDAESTLRGSYASTSHKRTPINITITTSRKRIKVSDPTPTNLSTKVTELVDGLNKNKANGAAIKYTVNKIDSEKDLSIKLTGYYKDLSGIEASLGFNFSKKQNRNYIMVDFTQIYYSIFTDPLSSNVFVDSSLNNTLGDYVYISNVIYGRRAILMMDTNYSEAEIQAALNVDYDNKATQGGGSANFDMKKIMRESTAKVLIYGGDARDAVKSITNSDMLRGFKNYIEGSFNAAGTGYGKPIGYNLRFANDNSLCAIRSVFKQTITECKPVSERAYLKLTIKSIKCLASDDRDNVDDYIITATAQAKNRDNNAIVIDHSDFVYRNSDHNKLFNKNNRITTLVTSRENKQIHIRENRTININNSVTYKIERDLLKSDASIDLKVNVTERSGNKRIALGRNEVRRIHIGEALKYLSGVSDKGDYGKPIVVKGDINGDYMNLAGGYTIMKETGSSQNRSLEGYFWMGNIKRKLAIFFGLDIVQ